MDSERYEAEMLEPEPKPKRKNEEYYLEPEPPRRRRWPWFLLGGCVMLCCLCFVLPLSVLSIGGAVFSAVIEGSEVTERGTEQIDVSGDTLAFVVDNEVGDVSIETGESGVITVDFVKRAYGISRGEARSRLDEVTVQLEESGEGEVRLSVDRPGARFSLARVDSVDLTVTVPADMVYDLSVNGDVGALRVASDVQVSHVDAEIDVGDIDFGGTFTEDVTDSRLRTDVGEISVSVPEDVFLRVEANTDVGAIAVDQSVSASDVDRQDDVTNERWRGTFGEGSGTPPLLEITISVGDIRIDAH